MKRINWVKERGKNKTKWNFNIGYFDHTNAINLTIGYLWETKTDHHPMDQWSCSICLLWWRIFWSTFFSVGHLVQVALRLPQGEHRQLCGVRLRLDHPRRPLLCHLVDGSEDDGSGGRNFERIDLPRVGLPLRVQLGRLHSALGSLAHSGWPLNIL